MKIILSRKGFDSSNGGFASPILPDGTLLSLPVPGTGKIVFSDITSNGYKYNEILNQLQPKNKVSSRTCHLDPDIRDGVIINKINNWKPAFGQCGAPQTHLENQGVTVDDLFLFFGWFRQTEIGAQGQLRYKKDAPNIHAFYGYMQVGDILQGDRIQEYPWHPHADNSKPWEINNTLYIPSPDLIIGNHKTGLPGFGTLEYTPRLVLTKEGMSRSRWTILDWFKDVDISYHDKTKCMKSSYFQSACIGQEFVAPANDKAIEWVKTILLDQK